MTSIAVCFLALITIGIIDAQMISSRQRQRGLMSRAQRGQIPPFYRNLPTQPGSLTRSSRGRQLPGPRHRHLQSATTRSRAQRLFNGGSGNLLARQASIGSNRLRPTGNRRRLSRPSNAMLLSALRHQPRPTKASKTQPSTTRALPVLGLKPSMINDQLKIFARNLQVIDSTVDLTRRQTSANIGHTKEKVQPVEKKAMPKEKIKITKSKRMLPETKGRGKEATPMRKTPIASPTGNPALRAPLRIRARLRQISSKAPKSLHRQAPDPSNINTINNGVGNKNVGEGKDPSKRRDMIAIDDIISLVKAIRGGKEASPVSSPNEPNVATSATTGSKMKKTISNNDALPYKNNVAEGNKKESMKNITNMKNNGIPASDRKNKKLTSEKPKNIVSPMNMLAQLALMTGGEGAINGGESGTNGGEGGMNGGGDSGGFLNSVFSNPAFFQQLVTGNEGSLLQMILTGSGETRQTGEVKGGHITGKEQSNINANPSVLQEPSGMKAPKTRNLVQDQILSSLMAHALKQFPEEIQENIRKRFNDGDTPTTGGKTRLTTLDPK